MPKIKLLSTVYCLLATVYLRFLMEVEKSFSVEEVEARGALCVECMAAVASGGEVFDRVGAVLCRACAAEFYAACGVCGGLVACDAALQRRGGGALFCLQII